MYSLQSLLLMSVFLVILPMEEESILKQRDDIIDSINALADNIPNAFNYRYRKGCLFFSCKSLVHATATCETRASGNANDLDALSLDLIKCAEDGACGGNKFVQPLKQTNIPLPGVNNQSDCYLTSNQGNLTLSDIKQTSKYTGDYIYIISVTGNLTLAEFNFTCLNWSIPHFQLIIKLNVKYSLNLGLQNGFPGSSLEFSATSPKKHANVVSKALKVFRKNKELLPSIQGSLRNLLGSLYNSFFMKMCNED